MASNFERIAQDAKREVENASKLNRQQRRNANRGPTPTQNVNNELFFDESMLNKPKDSSILLRNALKESQENQKKTDKLFSTLQELIDENTKVQKKGLKDITEKLTNDNTNSKSENTTDSVEDIVKDFTRQIIEPFKNIMPTQLAQNSFQKIQGEIYGELPELSHIAADLLDWGRDVKDIFTKTANDNEVEDSVMERAVDDYVEDDGILSIVSDILNNSINHYDIAEEYLGHISDNTDMLLGGTESDSKILKAIEKQTKQEAELAKKTSFKKQVESSKIINNPLSGLKKNDEKENGGLISKILQSLGLSRLFGSILAPLAGLIGTLTGAKALSGLGDGAVITPEVGDKKSKGKGLMGKALGGAGRLAKGVGRAGVVTTAGFALFDGAKGMYDERKAGGSWGDAATMGGLEIIRGFVNGLTGLIELVSSLVFDIDLDLSLSKDDLKQGFNYFTTGLETIWGWIKDLFEWIESTAKSIESMIFDDPIIALDKIIPDFLKSDKFKGDVQKAKDNKAALEAESKSNNLTPSVESQYPSEAADAEVTYKANRNIQSNSSGGNVVGNVNNNSVTNNSTFISTPIGTRNPDPFMTAFNPMSVY